MVKSSLNHYVEKLFADNRKELKNFYQCDLL